MVFRLYLLRVIIQCVYKWMVQFHKFTRNLFVTLHGHNVHREQRQLSKFLTRYQQFAFHAYWGAAGSVYKMAPQQEKAFCVLRLEVSRSVITVQREFRARFRKDTPCMVRLFLLRRHLGNWPRSPAVSTSERTAGSAWETWTVAAANGVRFASVMWEINFLLTFETAPFICKHPVETHVFKIINIHSNPFITISV